MAEIKEQKLTFKDLIAEEKNKTSQEKTKELLTLARMSEQAERYEEMCLVMGKIVKMKSQTKEALEVEERNMLSVAYKNVVGARRAAWRSIKSEADDPSQGDEDPVLMAQARTDYQAVVETELHSKCMEVLKLLQDNLLKTKEERAEMKKEFTSAEECPGLETQVFYLKMSGDYYRYLAEFKGGPKSDNAIAAEAKYEAALELADALAPTHPTRLGLALNASVCYWEILKDPKKACKLAKKAFDDAIQKLDSLSDNTYKDSTLIMQLLRDNLTIWTADGTVNQGTNNSTAKEEEEQD